MQQIALKTHTKNHFTIQVFALCRTVVATFMWQNIIEEDKKD